jgi:hypothetical protein
MDPYQSFSHSLISSKLWLCEQLETAIDNEHIKNPIVNILASWDSLLAFMMTVRRPEFYGVFNTYDIDLESVQCAERICDHWKYEYPKMYLRNKDINTLDFSNSDRESIFINCSVDQIDGVEWYDRIPADRLVCLQSTNLPLNHSEWNIKQSYSLEEFMKTYPMSRFLVCQSKTFTYSHLTFDRHMLIGVK